MDCKKTEPKGKKNVRRVKNDILFILSLVIIISLAGLALFFFREEGNTVFVEIDGEKIGEYPLSENLELKIVTGENEEDFNLLVIKDGKAYVKDANCPDGICASHRGISRDGESIVCLPHRVIINVRSLDGEGKPDIDIAA